MKTIAAIFLILVSAAMFLWVRPVPRLAAVSNPSAVSPFLAVSSSEDARASARPSSVYRDSTGRLWWRFDRKGGSQSVPVFRLDPDAFPEGASVAWFCKQGTPLVLLGSDSREFPVPKRVREQKVHIHRLAPNTLRSGVYLRFASPDDEVAGADSVFVFCRSENVIADALGYAPRTPCCSRDAIAFPLVSFLALSLFSVLILLYRRTGAFSAGVAALVVSYAFAAIWFDSPSYSAKGLIDRGDDSYYLAYAQNLVNHGDFFREPTTIRFGRRVIPNNHGMPGIALLLSPPLIPHVLFHRGEPISAAELRAMRAISAFYGFLATLFLFDFLRHLLAEVDPLDQSPIRAVRASPLPVLLPSLLLWGTSLSRWMFVRSIFTHSAEMALLALALRIVVCPPRPRLLRDLALATTVGFLCLVRGEIFLASPLFLLLPAPERIAGSAVPVRRATAATCLARLAPYILLGGFLLLFVHWTHHLQTGYGHLSYGTALGTGLVSVFATMARNAATLFGSFLRSGGLLPLTALSVLAAQPWLRRTPRRTPLPLRPGVLAILATVFFLLNCLFTPPLGDEFQHRYALKLYPLAIAALGLLLSDKRLPCAFRTIVSALATLSVALEIAQLTDLSQHDFGQNFSLLSDLQWSVLPPAGPAATNLTLAAFLLLLAAIGLLGSAVLSARRTRLGTSGDNVSVH